MKIELVTEGGFVGKETAEFMVMNNENTLKLITIDFDGIHRSSNLSKTQAMLLKEILDKFLAS